MKKVFLTSIAAVAALAALTLTSCKKEQQFGNMQFTATLESPAKTAIDNSTGAVSWTSTDKVMIYAAGVATPSEFDVMPKGDPTSATLTGDIIEANTYYAFYPSGIQASSSSVTLPTTQTYSATEVYAPMYAQSTNSTLQFRNLCGLLVLNVTTDKSISNIEITTPDNYITGTYDVACGGSTGTNLPTLSSTPTNGGHKVTLTVGGETPSNTNFFIYLPAGSYSSMEIKFNATDGSYATKSITSGSLEVERNYRYRFTFNDLTFINDLTTPLTFEAKTPGATVTFTAATDPHPTLQYSTDGINWTDYTGNPVQLTNKGDKVSFRGTNARLSKGTGSGAYSNFTGTGECYVYGNVMSLINATSYATATSFSKYNTFLYLFYGNSTICSHPSRKIVLPATTLAGGDYFGMFKNCTKLTTPPDLPATSLSNGSCYREMFKGCTSLTTAPVLRATTLVDLCYQEMFNGCTSLNSVKCLATNISASNCTKDWLNGVASTGTFTKAASISADTWYGKGVPSTWTVVDE